VQCDHDYDDHLSNNRDTSVIDIGKQLKYILHEF
jgi:hypothetical protein